MRGGHSRIRDGTGDQSECPSRVAHPRRLQVEDRVDRGGNSLEEQAIRLSPHDPRIGHFYRDIGFVHLLQSRLGEAILWLERARSAIPELPWTHLLLASAYGLRGETERAATELAEARGLQGGDRHSSIARIKAFSGGYGGMTPEIRTLLDATYIAGLRKAGVPEE